MKSVKRSDQRFMLVASAESIAKIRSTTSYAVLREMRSIELPKMLRQEYGVLHTQPIEESIHFAINVMEKRGAIHE